MAREREDLPFMPFFVRQWLTGEATMSMTPEQKGAFMDLLARAWNGDPPCSIPDDDGLLAKWSGLGRKWRTSGVFVKSQFKSIGDGRLRNTFQWERYQEQQDKRGGYQLGADKTNAKRWNQRVASESPSERSAVARASASSSSSGSEDNKHIQNLTPQQQGVATILGALETFVEGFVQPTGGRAARWAQEYGAEWVSLVVKDLGAKLDGKGASYLQAILRDRHASGWKPAVPVLRAVPKPEDERVDTIRESVAALRNGVRTTPAGPLDVTYAVGEHVYVIETTAEEAKAYIAYTTEHTGNLAAALTFEEWRGKKQEAK